MLTSRAPLRVAVLCSRRAPGLAHLLTQVAALGRAFEIVCVITSEPLCADTESVRAAGVPLQTHDIHAFYAAHASNVYRDFVTRREFDRDTLALLEPYAPDLVLLDGYVYLLTRPMLDLYRHRMLNLHFSDLTLRRPDHGPVYPGIRAVRDALADGLSPDLVVPWLLDERGRVTPPESMRRTLEVRSQKSEGGEQASVASGSRQVELR